MDNNQIILYALGGADKQYKVLTYYAYHEGWPGMSTIKSRVALLIMRNPGIKHIYMMENRYGLRREYTESFRINSIESCAIFKDTLEREGIKIY